MRGAMSVAPSSVTFHSPTGDGANCVAVPNSSFSNSARNSAIPSVAMSASSGGRSTSGRITIRSISPPSSAPTTTAISSVAKRAGCQPSPGIPRAAHRKPMKNPNAPISPWAMERTRVHLKINTTPTATSA